MTKPKIVFVSGADGMLGSNVVRELLRQNYAVRAMVQPGRNPKTLKGLERVEIVYQDLLEREKLVKSMKNCHAAIHIAAYASTNPARSDVFFKVNVEGTKNMVHAAQRHKLSRFIQISSSNSVGSSADKSCGGNEDTPWPGDLGFDYNLSKRLAHEYVMDKYREEGFPALAICPTFMIGEYDSGPSSGLLLVKHYKNPFLFYTGGGKNFVAARDVAVATVNALKKGRVGETYLCGNQNLEFREFFDLLSDVAQKRKPWMKMPSQIAIGFAALAEGSAKLFGQKPLVTPAMVKNASSKMYFDTSKARRQLDMPQTDIKVAINRAYQWFFKNGYLSPEKKTLQNKMNFQNKVAIITGSSTGIGFTTAELFLKRGAKVVINGRSKEKLDVAREELEQKGEVLAVAGDMSREEDVKLLIDKTLETFGQIDILICNAGIKFEDSFQRTEPSSLRKIVDVNFMGKVLPISFALPALMKSQGTVILISSLAGLYGLPGAVIYSASKQALTAMQQGLYLELSKYKIHTGIMYVGLTENDPKSGIMDGDGISNPIPDRGLPRQSRAAVAQAILRMIQYRVRRKVMTGMGLGLDVLARYFPSILRLIMKKRLKQIDNMLQPKSEAVPK